MLHHPSTLLHDNQPDPSYLRSGASAPVVILVAIKDSVHHRTVSVIFNSFWSLLP